MTSPAPADLNLGSPYRSFIRLVGYFLFTAAMIPMQLLALLSDGRMRVAIPRWYHRRCCRLFDFTIDCEGEMSTQRPTLFVSNHTSYLDITILGALIPGSFIAKTEVARWPFFGLLAKLQRTVFVDRRRETAAAQRDEIARRLDAGDNLILFPEGTSNDGNRILRFRSALLSVAERRVAGDGPGGESLTVQPVSLAYTRLNGFPIGRALRPFFAWYGDMDLFGHLWRVAGLGRLTVHVMFHPPVRIESFGTRKALSLHCHRAIADGVATALAGRRSGDPAPMHRDSNAGDVVPRP